MKLMKLFGFDTSGKSKDTLLKEYKAERKADNKSYKESLKKPGYFKGNIWTLFKD